MAKNYFNRYVWMIEPGGHSWHLRSWNRIRPEQRVLHCQLRWLWGWWRSKLDAGVHVDQQPPSRERRYAKSYSVWESTILVQMAVGDSSGIPLEMLGRVRHDVAKVVSQQWHGIWGFYGKRWDLPWNSHCQSGYVFIEESFHRVIYDWNHGKMSGWKTVEEAVSWHS